MQGPFLTTLHKGSAAASLPRNRPPLSNVHVGNVEDTRPISNPLSDASALIFKNERSLHLLSHFLATQRLNNSKSELEAGPWPPAREDQAVLLHAIL